MRNMTERFALTATETGGRAGGGIG